MSKIAVICSNVKNTGFGEFPPEKKEKRMGIVFGKWCKGSIDFFTKYP
jgi:hypothetical protein